MKIRSGVYIVPTNRWYIERTVWLIAGIVLLTSTALALLVNPLWILGVTATGLVSINVAFTGFCPVGSVLQMLGFTPMLGTDKPSRWKLYFMKTDKWYLERRIYLAVGFNISVASTLILLMDSVGESVHALRGRRHGVVCRHWLLCDGQRALLAGSRAAAEPGNYAFGALRRMRHVGSLRGRA